MADLSLQAESARANPTLAKALFSAALRFEEMGSKIERIRAVAIALASSDVIEETAQDSLRAIADLCAVSLDFAREAEQEFTDKAAQHR